MKLKQKIKKLKDRRNKENKMKITGIEVDGVMYDLAPIMDEGYVCACCDFLVNYNDNGEKSADSFKCPIDPNICEKVIGQCSLQRRN